MPRRVEKLTSDIVIRALGRAGHRRDQPGHRQGPATAIEFKAPIARDGPGWRADVDLPYGVTVAEVMDRRDKLASGLRRPLGCVWPEADHAQHPGRLVLWVGDQDMSKARQPAWPLARHGERRPVQAGPVRHRPAGPVVTVTLMFVSVIIGSIPRMGKTFLLRLLALIAALDVRAELHLYDFKGTGDLSPLEPVAHRYRAGDDDEDIAYALADFRALREELRRRTKVIRGPAPRHLPGEQGHPRAGQQQVPGPAPDRDRRGRVPGHVRAPQARQPSSRRSAPTWSSAAPPWACVLILATQRPDAKSLPTGISANAVLRMCLKVMGQVENDMVLGTSAYKNGIRATMFAFSDKGICYFAGEGEAPAHRPRLLPRRPGRREDRAARPRPARARRNPVRARPRRGTRHRPGVRPAGRHRRRGHRAQAVVGDRRDPAGRRCGPAPTGRGPTWSPTPAPPSSPPRCALRRPHRPGVGHHRGRQGREPARHHPRRHHQRHHRT